MRRANTAEKILNVNQGFTSVRLCELCPNGGTLGGRARDLVLLQRLGMDGIWDVHTSRHISADGHWTACRVASFDLQVESIHLDCDVYQEIGTKKRGPHV